MSDAQAGTPPTPPDDSQKVGTPEAVKDVSGQDAQKWEEALKWKQKAEDYNKVAREKEALEARYQELERLAYGRGAGQATDPTVELVTRLKEQAQYDDVAKATLLNMEMTAKAQAEAWLSGELASVPQNKRANVAALIRNVGYQMSVEQALSIVTDPESEASKARLAQLEAENERLRTARPNGSSPAMTTPSADDGRHLQTIKRSEYLAILQQGGDRAKELMQAVGNNKTRLVADQ